VIAIVFDYRKQTQNQAYREKIERDIIRRKLICEVMFWQLRKTAKTMGVNMPNKTFDSIPEDKVEYDLSDRIQIAWHVS